MHIHSTDIAISRLKIEGMYCDGKTPAFGIRIGKHHKRWFVVRGRERNRKYLGRYPGKSLAVVRKEAKAPLTEPMKEQSRSHSAPPTTS